MSAENKGPTFNNEQSGDGASNQQAMEISNDNSQGKQVMHGDGGTMTQENTFAERVNPWKQLNDAVAELPIDDQDGASEAVFNLQDVAPMEELHDSTLDLMDESLQAMKRYGPNLGSMAANILLGSPIGAVKDAKEMLQLFLED